MRKTLVIIFTLLFLIGCGKNNNINNLNLDTTILDQKKAEAALKIEEFYTVESWQKLQEALILPQDNIEEIDEKTLKIESALENFLIAKSEELLDTIHYDEQKKSRFTLLSYIKKIINQGNIGEFGGKLERFFNQSEYMGNLDVSTVTNPGQLSANPNEMKFLFLVIETFPPPFPLPSDTLFFYKL